VESVMVEKSEGQGLGGRGGAAPGRGGSTPGKPAHDPATRSALAHSLFAQLKAAAEAEGAGPSASSPAAKAAPGAAMSPSSAPPSPVGFSPGIQSTTVGGIRVVGPAAQARVAAAAAAQGRPAGAVPVQASAPALARVPARAPTSTTPVRQAAGAKPSAKPLVRRRPRFRLLPITIFLLVLMLGVRVGDSWRVLTRGGGLPEVAPLQAQTPSPPASPGGAAPKAKEPAAGAAGKAPPAKEDADPSAADANDASRLPRPETVDLELVKHLTDRREELDGRARQLDQREALMVAAEKRLDQKLAELEGVRNEIQSLLKQIDDKQKAQLESLVRIYETMKPKDAARIFEALEMPVLLEVVERMKEAKTALILGAMDPIKAKDLTTALAERRRLPTVPQ